MSMLMVDVEMRGDMQLLELQELLELLQLM
jgi:hypothetical protein